MSENYITVNSPLGYEVIIDEKQLKQHIATGHPEVLDPEENVNILIKSITSPIKVFKDTKHSNRDAYFGSSNGATYSNEFPLVKSVVEIDSVVPSLGKLITSYPIKDFKGGIDKEAPIYENDKKD